MASAGKLREGVQLLVGDREQYVERMERQYVVGQREQQQQDQQQLCALRPW